LQKKNNFTLLYSLNFVGIRILQALQTVALVEIGGMYPRQILLEAALTIMDNIMEPKALTLEAIPMYPLQSTLYSTAERAATISSSFHHSKKIWSFRI